MAHSKPLFEQTGSLSLIATPIGNLEDITLRAINQLKNSDAILCEDTRVTKRLLSRYNIHATLIVLHDHNEKQSLSSLINQMQEGKHFSLVSDAGTPVFSDPGYGLVRAAKEAGIPVTAFPGCNAAVTGLILSGLPPAPFSFLGFPARKQSERLHHFRLLSSTEQNEFSATLIWYESPNRLLATLTDLITVFGAERACAAARELTKYYEEVKTGTLEEVKTYFTENTPRGEFVLMIGPQSVQIPEEDIENHIIENLHQALQNHSFKDAVTVVSGLLNLPRKRIYATALSLKKDS